MKFILGLAIVLVMMAVSVQAIGIAVPYMAGNKVDIADREDFINVTFQLQNAETDSRSVLFKVDANDQLLILGGNYYEAQFTLAAGEARNVTLTFSSDIVGRYRVDYSVSESCSSSGGICFDSGVSNYFFIDVEESTPEWYQTFNQNYVDYTIEASSFANLAAVRDPRIVSKNGRIIVDYSGSSLDLRNFNESDVIIGTREINIKNLKFNKVARFTFYDIMSSRYSVNLAGSFCSSLCSSYSYSASSDRLMFTAKGYGDFKVDYIADEVTSPGGSSSPGSGGVILPRNVTKLPNVSSVPVPVVAVPDPVIEQQPILEPVKEVVETPVTMPVQERGPPVAFPQAENTGGTITLGSMVFKGKDLLTSIVILGGITWILGIGLLLYYRRNWK